MLTTNCNWKNRTLFHGDNLKIMRAMNSASVDLIATDPPFNKGRDFHATPESLSSGASFQDRWSWKKDIKQQWIDQITDDHPNIMNTIKNIGNSYGDDMAAFLCFMAIRLLAMHRILKPTGSIYLHCDPTASHYLKELMDTIFGRDNFRNEIIWGYMWGGVGKREFAHKHDVILWYSKSKQWIFNHEDMREPYRTKDKKWHNHSSGKILRDVWDDIPIINTRSKERVGYPTQKPLPLYERIIKASSRPGDMVFDPFAGCATTCVAAENLNRQWVGIDIWEKFHKVAVSRLQQQTDCCDKVHIQTTPP